MMPILPKNRPPTHPGEMLQAEFLTPLDLSQTEVARRLGISYPRLNEVINGRRAVTPDTALRLERLFGMDADFWLNLQRDWDLYHTLRGASSGGIRKVQPLRGVNAGDSLGRATAGPTKPAGGPGCYLRPEDLTPAPQACCCDLLVSNTLLSYCEQS